MVSSRQTWLSTTFSMSSKRNCALRKRRTSRVVEDDRNDTGLGFRIWVFRLTAFASSFSRWTAVASSRSFFLPNSRLLYRGDCGKVLGSGGVGIPSVGNLRKGGICSSEVFRDEFKSRCVLSAAQEQLFLRSWKAYLISRDSDCRTRRRTSESSVR
jgi:hypothetical protein